MSTQHGRDRGAHSAVLGQTSPTTTGDRAGRLGRLRRGHRAPEPGPPTLPDPPTDGAPAPQPVGPQPPARTRAGSTWVIACVAVLILIALIIFIAQNAGPVQVSFVSLHGRFSLAVALLAAMAAGCLLTLVLGTTRILQLRRLVRRRHRDDLAAAAESRTPGSPSEGPPPRDPTREGAGADRTR